MASPQIEDGFTRIANELLEVLPHPGMSGSELRMVLVIIRKTYGFQKTQDRISLSQLQQATFMNRAQCVRTLKELMEKGIVIRKDGVLKLNKNYADWKVEKRGSIQKDTHKRKKEIYKENISKTDVLHGDQWQSLIDAFAPINPSYLDFYENKTERNALERMTERWGYQKLISTIEALPEIIIKPYAPKITKPSELKRDIGKLLAYTKQQSTIKPKKRVIL